MDLRDASASKKLLDLCYICPRGTRKGMPHLVFEKSVFVKHTTIQSVTHHCISATHSNSRNSTELTEVKTQFNPAPQHNLSEKTYVPRILFSPRKKDSDDRFAASFEPTAAPPWRRQAHTHPSDQRLLLSYLGPCGPFSFLKQKKFALTIMTELVQTNSSIAR